MILNFKQFLIFAFIITLHIIPIDTKEIDLITNIKCNEGEFLSNLGCITKCPEDNEYFDQSLHICTTQGNCSKENPFSDSTTKKCVTAANCHWSTPFGDIYTKSCVRAEDCSRYIPDAYADLNSKLCTIRNKDISNVKNLNITTGSSGLAPLPYLK